MLRGRCGQKKSEGVQTMQDLDGPGVKRRCTTVGECRGFSRGRDGGEQTFLTSVRSESSVSSPKFLVASC